MTSRSEDCDENPAGARRPDTAVDCNVLCAAAHRARHGVVAGRPAHDGDRARGIAQPGHPQLIAADPIPGAVETPQSSAFREVTAAWLAKYVPHDTLLAIATRSYERAYSADELRQLLEFFHGPVGQRFVAGQREIFVTARASLDSILSAHRAEYQRELLGVMQRGTKP